MYLNKKKTFISQRVIFRVWFLPNLWSLSWFGRIIYIYMYIYMYVYTYNYIYVLLGTVKTCFLPVFYLLG